MLLLLHPNIIVHVENVVSLFSSPSTSSQKVRKCDVTYTMYAALPTLQSMMIGSELQK